MNALVGEKLSIITRKAQTTRHRIAGIINGKDYQIVYSDTPGIIKPNYRMQEAMLKFAMSALEDADIILYVTDVIEKEDFHHKVLQRIGKVSVPILILINKADLAGKDDIRRLREKWTRHFPEAEIHSISALRGINLDTVMQKILDLLPEHPPYFPRNQLTDRSERFFVSEIIREKILNNYSQEIPYSVEVEIESFREEENIIRIHANIIVNKNSQKGIIIGHHGKALKKTGTEARIDLERFFGKKIYIELFVKVRKDWRDNMRMLRTFGYNPVT